MTQHHGLPEQGADLGAADVENIREPCQIRHGDIVDGRGQTIAQPCSVHKQQKIPPVAGGPDGGQLLQGVEGTVFRRVGQIDHGGLHLVLMGVIVPMGRTEGLNLAGGQAARVAGQGQNLVAGGLDGAGFVAADMAGLRGQHTLMGPQGSGNDRGVGLSAAGQKMDVHILPAAQGFHLGSGPVADGVGGIAGILGMVFAGDGIQNLRDAPFRIIAFKTQHGNPSFIGCHYSIETGICPAIFGGNDENDRIISTKPENL